MIKAYFVGISTQYEGEDIEIRYSVFNEEELIVKKKLFLDYQKPALVGHVGIITMLRDLEKYKKEEIIVYINDGSLYEAINATSGTKNREVLEKAKETRREIKRFDALEIVNITGDYKKTVEWDQVLSS